MVCGFNRACMAKKREVLKIIFLTVHLPGRHLDGDIRNLMDKIGKARVVAAKLHKVLLQIAGTGKKEGQLKNCSWSIHF